MKSYFRTLSTVIVCLSCTLLCAAPVSQSAALQQAQSFLAQRGRLCTLQSCETGRANKPNKVNQASSAPYHIFNVAGNGGFVIVSGDDNAMPILGYADQGYIDPDNMPNALRELLDGYADEMAYLTSHNLSAPAQAPSRKIQLIRRPIAPLIQTHWNQNGGYNHFTPTDQTPNGMKHSYTGCIATSMAQLMYYHRWPNATTQTIPGYLAPSLNRQLDSLPVTAFDYDAMALVYNNNTDSSAIIAVSKLMQYCGWAMELDYTTAGTSGFSEFIPNALIDYFDYDSSTTYVQRLNYSYEGWMDLLYNELANGRPLAYAAQRTEGGHSFLCDGYDADDYFHFNFGWGGSGDGYYRVSALNPTSSSSTDIGKYADGGYNYQHAVIIGIQPNTGEAPKYAPIKITRFCFTGDTCHTKVYHRDSVTGTFRGIKVSFSVTNTALDTAIFDYIVKVIDAETGQWATTFHEKISKPDTLKWYLHGKTWNLTKTLTPLFAHGSFRLLFQARIHGTQDWKDALYNDLFYMDVVVDSLDLILTAKHTPSATPELIDLTSSGPHTVGQQDTVTARLLALDGEFRCNYLALTRSLKFKDVATQHAYILRGDTATVQFLYKPQEAGIDTLSVWDGSYMILPQDTNMSPFLCVPIADNPNKPFSNNLPVSSSVQVSNLIDNTLYGNGLQADVTFVNHSPDSAFQTYVYVEIFQWTQADDGTWSSERKFKEHKQVTAPKQTGQTPDTLHVPFLLTDLSAYGQDRFSIRFSYDLSVDSTTTKCNIEHFGMEDGHGVIRISGGYALVDATGTCVLCHSSGTVNCGNACVVDLQAIDVTGAIITPSTNPNCLYLLQDSAAVPAALIGRNIVKNKADDDIVLTDSCDFYFPDTLQVSQISYSRIIPKNSNHTVWQTLMLPFSPTSIDADLIIRSVDYDVFGTIYLREEIAIEAYKPYLIALPNDNSGSFYGEVTFSAADCQLIKTPKKCEESMHYYTVNATNKTVEKTDAFVLKNAGTFFVKMSEVTVPAFYVWLTANTISSNRIGVAYIEDSTTTSIEKIATENVSDDNAWYTLTGQKIGTTPTLPGAYIHQGKVEIF